MSPIQKLITPETIARRQKVEAMKVGESLLCTSEFEAKAVGCIINRTGHSCKTCQISPRRWSVFKLAPKKGAKIKDIPQKIDFNEIEIPAPMAKELLNHVDETLAAMKKDKDAATLLKQIEEFSTTKKVGGVSLGGMELNVIESNIPIPTARNCKRGAGRYFATVQGMQVNDSVLVPNEKEAQALGAEIKHQGSKSTARKMAGGFRVWRTN